MLFATASVFSQRVPITVDSARYGVPVRSYQQIRQSRIVRQKWDLSCGAAALSSLLTFDLGDPTSESEIVVWILHRTDPVKIQSRGGFSLLDLKHFADFRGYDGTGFAGLSLRELIDQGMPAIVPIRVKGYDHFVLFRGATADRIFVADPAFGNLTMAAARFEHIWKNGIAFVVRPRLSPAPRVNLAQQASQYMVPSDDAIFRALQSAMHSEPTRR
jgi:hypothetical protein